MKLLKPGRTARAFWCGCVAIVSIAACQSDGLQLEEPTPIPPPAKQTAEVSAAAASTGTLFDDFSYPGFSLGQGE